MGELKRDLKIGKFNDFHRIRMYGYNLSWVSI